MLAWLSVGKSPAVAGYAVDVVAAPLFAGGGCSALAYTDLAWRSGNPWPLNLAAVRARL